MEYLNINSWEESNKTKTWLSDPLYTCHFLKHRKLIPPGSFAKSIEAG